MHAAESILIIEDDADIRGFASRVLEIEGYRVLQAADGAHGVSTARQNQVSLILLDLRLPDCDGWAVLEELREDRRLFQVPVVMFTASAASARRSQALAAGVVEYLVKPLSATGLRETVERVLHGRKGQL